jgi:hypothetical protein
MAFGTFNGPAAQWGQRNIQATRLAPTVGDLATTLNMNEQIVIVDISAVNANHTITLPAAHLLPPGHIISIIRTEGDDEVVLASNAADLVALSTPNLTAPGDYCVLCNGGFMWAVVQEVST